MASFVNAVILWTALAIIAISAAMALHQAYRRDHVGRIHDTAPKALPTLVIGAVFAATLAFSPHLAAAAQIVNDSPAVSPSRVTDAITEAWVWVAAGVGIACFYALAAALFTAGMYYRQQRRRTNP